jgi:Flp pilus assembly protein TadD
MLARDRRFDEAIFHFQTAIRLEPEHADAHLNLGMIYYGRGNDVKAERYWRTAAQLGPNRVEYLRPLAWVLATSHDPIARNGREAVELAERAMAASPQPDPNVIGTLAAAYAETGDFVKAAANAERARDLAERQGNDRLSDELSQRLMDYRNGKPFHGAKPLTE